MISFLVGEQGRRRSCWALWQGFTSRCRRSNLGSSQPGRGIHANKLAEISFAIHGGLATVKLEVIIDGNQTLNPAAVQGCEMIHRCRIRAAARFAFWLQWRIIQHNLKPGRTRFPTLFDKLHFCYYAFVWMPYCALQSFADQTTKWDSLHWYNCFFWLLLQQHYHSSSHRNSEKLPTLFTDVLS